MLLKLMVQGGFWQGLVVANIFFPFVGTIELDTDTGMFKGEMVDHFGDSDLQGQTDRRSLSYAKKYRPGSTGDSNIIRYEYLALGGVAMPGYTGCWIGNYQLAITEIERADPLIAMMSTNKAYCIIAPPETFV